jgi:hypothetical protein
MGDRLLSTTLCPLGAMVNRWRSWKMTIRRKTREVLTRGILVWLFFWRNNGPVAEPCYVDVVARRAGDGVTFDSGMGSQLLPGLSARPEYKIGLCAPGTCQSSIIEAKRVWELNSNDWCPTVRQDERTCPRCLAQQQGTDPRTSPGICQLGQRAKRGIRLRTDRLIFRLLICDMITSCPMQR